MLTDPLAKTLLDSDVAKPPGVHNVRLNTLARSVVIEYDAERIPPAMLDQLMAVESDEEAAGLVEELDGLLRIDA